MRTLARTVIPELSEGELSGVPIFDEVRYFEKETDLITETVGNR